MKQPFFNLTILLLLITTLSFSQSKEISLKDSSKASISVLNDEINKMKIELSSIKGQISNAQHVYDQIIKRSDDLMWIERLSDIAWFDKVRLAGPPRWRPKNKNDRFAANPLQFYCYVFVPKNIDLKKKYPLIVLPHSGVHADFSTYYVHIVREMIAQGYIVVSAEYRGSTGYGKETYENIDYGGLENEDVLVSRDYMVENYSFVDENRVGIVGWSHGGMISLMNVLKYPQKYQCAFAGVPVSDLNSRLTSHDQEYMENFTAKYHIGKSLKEDPSEYKRRSPSTYAKDLKKPLMIYTNTNDNDVYVEEVLIMIDSLKHHRKNFEYKVFENSPGGHGFDRIDTKIATDIRFSIYKFLEKYLNPPIKFNSPAEMRKAAYRF